MNNPPRPGMESSMPQSASGKRTSLVDALDRLLSTGAALGGELTLSVADVDLVYVGLRAVARSSTPDDVDLRMPAHSQPHAISGHQGSAQ